jgi:hypothetical protein
MGPMGDGLALCSRAEGGGGWLESKLTPSAPQESGGGVSGRVGPVGDEDDPSRSFEERGGVVVWWCYCWWRAGGCESGPSRSPREWRGCLWAVVGGGDPSSSFGERRGGEWGRKQHPPLCWRAVGVGGGKWGLWGLDGGAGGGYVGGWLTCPCRPRPRPRPCPCPCPRPCPCSRPCPCPSPLVLVLIPVVLVLVVVVIHRCPRPLLSSPSSFSSPSVSSSSPSVSVSVPIVSSIHGHVVSCRCLALGASGSQENQYLI